MFVKRCHISWITFTLCTWLLLLTYFTSALDKCPKIITKDGNLVIKSAKDHNISFILHGTSRLMLNDHIDLIDLFTFKMQSRNASLLGENVPDYDGIKTDLQMFQNMVHRPQGINQSVRRLVNRTRNTQRLISRTQGRLTRLKLRVDTLSQALQMNNCTSNPCQNGGTCLQIYSGYICKCNSFYEGKNCEIDINECALYNGTDLGCQNGGQCINTIGGFNCICAPGWYGTHCSQRKGDCMQASSWELCGHGTCISSNNVYGYQCICDQGWKTNGLTPACLTDVDECTESQPPCHTKCINLPGSFMCAPCQAGLTGNGINCQDINECQLENGGCSTNPHVPCINTYGSFQCGECPLGWYGDGRSCLRTNTNADDTIADVTCNDRSNICHPDAICSIISNTVVCTCKAGMLGNGIGPNGCVVGKPSNCDGLPCLNGGTCLDNGGAGYTCLCAPGFTAPNCQPLNSPCLPNPCANGGTCAILNNGTAHCICAAGYTGNVCEKRRSRCGGRLDSSTGQLKYPPNNLNEHNSQCAWVIQTVENKVLNVTFKAFDMEDTTECRSNFLQLNDGPNTAAQLIGRFCSSKKPLGGNVITSTNNLYLWFRVTDNNQSREGFELEWQSIDPICGGLIEVESHGSIATPGSPGNYPKNRDCVWHLRAPNTKRLKLTFFSLQIEQHDSCNFDYVEITDTISGAVLQKYCNSTHPAPQLLPTNEMTIKFHSDSVGTDSGFQIHYSIEDRSGDCGGVYTAKEGIIKSPATIAESISCEYDIKMSGTETIRVDFNRFEMGNGDCLEIYDVNPVNKLKTLQGRYCGNEEVSPVQLHSFYNTLHIQYYSTGGQFELSYKADCSNNFETDSGIIVSSNYPQLNKADRFCTYKIITEPNTVITLTIEDFELLDSIDETGQCEHTFLTINAGADKQILGPYCGNNTPETMVLTSNMAIINLHTDASSSGRGFKFNYIATAANSSYCGGVYTKPEQKIRLQTNADGEYEHNSNCNFVILAPANMGIILNWVSFKLEESPYCFDYVEIYDHIPISDDVRPFGHYCTMPPAIQSHTRMLVIKFVSDYSDANEGFEATFDFVDVMKTCGGEIMSTNGKLVSPGWPSNYTHQVDCIWILNSASTTQLQLTIDLFELETSTNCTKDFLELRNGGSVRAPLIGRYCGTMIVHTIPSFTSQLYIHFHTDAFINARGFRISWSLFASGCGGMLNGDHGAIASPLYPKPYPINALCEWRIRVPDGSNILIRIDDLLLEDLFDCSYDSLEVFSGFTAVGNPIRKLCALKTDSQKLIAINDNRALVRFQSDASNNERGFLLNFESNCVVNITNRYGVIESPNYGQTGYTNAINCSWTIVTFKGSSIQLDWTYYEEFEEGDSLYISEMYTNGTTKWQTIDELGTFNSISNIITLHQNSSLVSFRLEYAIIGCSQLLDHETGTFHTPNFPQAYPNDIECIWEIQVPTIGKSIEITFGEFDLENAVNCTKDSLMVSMEAIDHHVNHRYCGKHANLVITKGSHHVYVHFKSDLNNNANGFNATYRTINAACGGRIQAKNGIITSPNYPMAYPPNSECEWLIEVALHHTIDFEINDLDVEVGFASECDLDYLEAIQFIKDIDTPVPLFKVCLPVTLQNNKWSSKSNEVQLRFITDDSFQQSGFKLTFKESCGQTITVTDAYELFTFQGDNHHLNDTCTWTFVANEISKHVYFTIDDVKLTKTAMLNNLTEEQCAPNGVQIFDGLDATAPLRAKFCGTHPPALSSNGYSLTLQVPQDLIAYIEVSYTIMDSICGNVHRSLTGKFTTPYYPDSYPVNIECEWYIEASYGNKLSFSIESFDLENSDECNKDYLEIRDDYQGKLLGTFCGSTAPPMISGLNTLWLKFQSDDDNVGRGFLASYSYDLHSELNGTDGKIVSPLYPHEFHTNDVHSWRISVDRTHVILLEIAYITDAVSHNLKIYDGYSDMAVTLEHSKVNPLRSSTNYVFITASRGPFELDWTAITKESIKLNKTMEEMSRICGNTKIVLDKMNVLTFNSAGYPNGYAANLNCTWEFISENPEKHTRIVFHALDLENVNDCAADYVQVSTSSNMVKWESHEKLCKLPTHAARLFDGTPYLKVQFITDSSSNKTGFSLSAMSVCGSTLTKSRYYVNITAYPVFDNLCVWLIEVATTHRIRIRFPESILNIGNNITSVTECQTYIIVRNGIDEDSPFLGKGKYCNNHIDDVLETSSNHAYVKFVRYGLKAVKLSFHYEEITHTCSRDIVLTEQSAFDRMQTITSPNYPNIPNAHIECVWHIKAPYHHVIAVNFLDKFDLMDGTGPTTSACDREYVQVIDGSTQLSPFKNRYCGTKRPNSWTSSGNLLRIQYFTDVAVPHIGFKLNVSIGICGGTYYEKEGVITQPTMPAYITWSGQMECVYTIETAFGSTIQLEIQQMNLNVNVNNDNCTNGSYLRLEEIMIDSGDGSNMTDSMNLCDNKYSKYLIETNKVIIYYRFNGAKPPVDDKFQIHYTEIGARCGETISSLMGLLTSPNYPNGVKRPTYCKWIINVPKGNRIKLEFLDFDTGAPLNTTSRNAHLRNFYGRMILANDKEMSSIIARITHDPPAVVYSTDNIMAIQTFLLANARHRGIKLRYSTYAHSQHCKYPLLLNDNLQFRGANDTAVYCSYDLKPKVNTTIVLRINRINTGNHSQSASQCQYNSPLVLKLNNVKILESLICGNMMNPDIYLPYPVTVSLTANSRNKLQELDLQLETYNCGGIINYELYDEITIQQPNITAMNMQNANMKMYCAWAIWPTDDNDDLDDSEWLEMNQLVVTLNANLIGNCEDNHLILYNGPNQNSPRLDRKCNQAHFEHLIAENGFFVEYYTNNYKMNSTFNITLKPGSGCGGKLTYPYRQIFFNDQYQNNVECIWEISTEPGFHIGLIFLERFFIESSPQCQKDYLRVQEKDEESDTWLDIERFCGRENPQPVNTTSNHMRLIFHSDDDILGDGFVAKFERNCGGVMYANEFEQKLTSPGFPLMTKNNLYCKYTILPTKNANGNDGTDGILVKFQEIDLERSPTYKCISDTITLLMTKTNHSGVEEVELCNKHANLEFRGTNNITVILTTDGSVASKGFQLTFSTNVCGGLITHPTTLRSPHDHRTGRFPPNTNCFWNITAPLNSKIVIKFVEIDFANLYPYDFDMVEIYKGFNATEEKRLARFSGHITRNLPTISIDSNEGLIHSYAYTADASKGFKAIISFVPNCNRYVYMDDTNSTFEFRLTNNTSNTTNYLNNQNCDYVFKTQSNRKFAINFQQFHIEDSVNCVNDYLEIYDGSAQFSDLIGKLCGHVLPADMITSRNALYMHFVSDNDVTSTGVHITIKLVPWICGDSHIVLKDNEPYEITCTLCKYANNLNCYWSIQADYDIHLKFNHFDLNLPNQKGICDRESLTITDYDDTKYIENGYGSHVEFNGLIDRLSNQLGKFEHIYCGNRTPNDYYVYSKRIFIKLRMGTELGRSGFSLTATVAKDCNRNYTATQGLIVLTNFSTECNVHIKAPLNHTLSLYFNSGSYYNENCSTEYIEIFDTHTSKLLHKICSPDELEYVFTATNELRLHFKRSQVFNAYNITFVASTAGIGCGGDLYGLQGALASPLYPNSVRNNSDCRWNFHVPQNMKVLLQFKDFNLGERSTCYTDFLHIIEPKNEKHPDETVREFCGGDRPTYYKSEQNSLSLRFHKTVNFDGTGWALTFRAVRENYSIVSEKQ